MVSLQLSVLPRSRWALGVLCRGIGSIVIRGVGWLTTPVILVVSMVPTSLSHSLSLLVIGGGLIREDLLSVDLSFSNNRI